MRAGPGRGYHHALGIFDTTMKLFISRAPSSSWTVLNSTRAVQGPSNTQSFARDVREICYILRSAHTTKCQKHVKHPKNAKLRGRITWNSPVKKLVGMELSLNNLNRNYGRAAKVVGARERPLVAGLPRCASFFFCDEPTPLVVYIDKKGFLSNPPF